MPPLFSNDWLQVHVVFQQHLTTSWKEVCVSEGEHPSASKWKSEVLPLQYQDNGEIILSIQKQRMARII